MRPAPSVLLLDDGELDGVRRALDWLNVRFEHVARYQGQPGVQRPDQLLVTTARLALQVEHLEHAESAPAPVWVCAHNQDFLPMRERLRGLGVHYLVNSGLEAQTLRLFFLQILHRGREQRRNLRLHMNEEVGYELAGARGKGQLEELSVGGCRLRVDEPVAVGAPAIVRLPPQLCSGREMSLVGYATEVFLASGRGAGDGTCVILVFQDLEAEVQAQLEAILAGESLGTRITPLGAGSGHTHGDATSEASDPPASPATADPDDRRAQTRRAYGRRVSLLGAEEPMRYRARGTILDPAAPDILLGRDLSVTGIRIDPHPSLATGKLVTLALYGGDEPLEIEARVIRRDLGGYGLRFDSLDEEQREALERLCERLPELESLEAQGGVGHSVVVSRLIHQG